MQNDIGALRCGGNSRMLNPVCSLTAVMCGQPPPVQDGKVEGTDFRWGASISYSCAHGFQLSQPAILSCEGRGVWKGEVPQCLRKSSGAQTTAHKPRAAV